MPLPHRRLNQKPKLCQLKTDMNIIIAIKIQQDQNFLSSTKKVKHFRYTAKSHCALDRVVIRRLKINKLRLEGNVQKQVMTVQDGTGPVH